MIETSDDWHYFMIGATDDWHNFKIDTQVKIDIALWLEQLTVQIASWKLFYSSRLIKLNRFYQYDLILLLLNMLGKGKISFPVFTWNESFLIIPTQTLVILYKV